MPANEITQDTLWETLERVFERENPKYDSAREAMSYWFEPEVTSAEDGSLLYDVILNPNRDEYVQRLLAAKANTDKTEGNSASSSQPESIPAWAKRSLAAHCPPLGKKECPFDGISAKPLTLGRFRLEEQNYLAVVNSRPWSHWHCMLVTEGPEPQEMTREHLRAALKLPQILGIRFEVMFNGISASASVPHYHLQMHRGCSAIWKNLENGSLERDEFYQSPNVTASRLDGWPACAYLFESDDQDALATTVTAMLDALVAGDNDIPFNLTIRRVKGESKVIVIPRSLKSERPEMLNGNPKSWSLFGCMEMSGSILLLKRDGFDECAADGSLISNALREMTISGGASDQLIEDYLQATETLTVGASGVDSLSAQD